MKKLLVISALFPPEPVVSANLSLDITKGLRIKNHVSVVSPLPTRPLGFDFNRQYSIDNSNFNHTRLKSYTCPQSNLFGRLKESYSFGRHCKRYIKQNKKNIDIIYANTWPLMAQYITVKVAKKYNIPIIIHVQDIYPESLTNKLPLLGKIINFLLLPIDKYTLRNATYVIAISDKMKSYLIKTRELDNEKVHVIQNWQDEEEFIRFKHSKQGDNCKNDFTFMYLGNIGPVAGIDLLIDAFGKSELSNCRLIIAGSGSQKETLQKKCIEKQLINIEFWPVPEGKVSEIQNQADVMLLPIKKGAASSSIPSKLPAYMFSAKPIISCVDEDSDTANAIKEANCGWVLSPEDIELLAETMKQVIHLSNNVLQKKGKNGFDYAMENFSKQKNLDLLTRLIIQTIPS